MKKFEFNLEKLLSYKGQILDSEMMTLAVLNSQMEKTTEKLQMQYNKLQNCKNELENKLMKTTTPAACRLSLQYTGYLKGEIKHTEKEILELSVQVDDQVEVIKSLKLETKSLEILKTSKLDEYNKENIKVAEHQIEEFVSTSKHMGKNF